MNARITWVTGTYGTLTGKLPGLKNGSCFTVSMSMTRNPGESQYVLRNRLPGFKEQFDVDSQEAGKEKAEQLLTLWVSKIGAQWVPEKDPAEAE